MKRVARFTHLQVQRLVFVWLLLAAFVAFVTVSHARVGPFLAFPFGLMVAVVIWDTVDKFVSRATMTPNELVLRGLYPRKSLRTDLSAVTRYGSDERGTWWVAMEARRVKVPVGSPWNLHAAFVDFAPNALRAKRLRTGREPSGEEFRGLWTFDTGPFASSLVAYLSLYFAMSAVSDNHGGIAGLLLGVLTSAAGRVGERLDVTREGIAFRNFFHRTFIPWSEATAIFREGGKLNRSFVVTGRETGIEIPTHLAREWALMEAVFFSLPDGALCVNFDETTSRGYRKRGKKTEISMPETLPLGWAQT